MKIGCRVVAAAWVVGLVVSAGGARGAALLTDSGGPSTVFNRQGGAFGLDQVLGYSFSVGERPLEVSALGMWDFELDGLPAELHVGLWDDGTNALVAEVTVPAGTGARLEGEFRYVDLPAGVRVESGRTYTIGYRKTLASSAGLVQLMETSPTFAADVMVGAGRLRTSTLFYLPGAEVLPLDPSFPQAPLAGQRPTVDLGSGGVPVGPNLLYSVVPEPGSLALAVGGMVVMGLWRRGGRR